jgi:hypothetical protein
LEPAPSAERGQRLKTIQRAVAADTDQSVNSKVCQSRRNEIEFILLVGIDVVA